MKTIKISGSDKKITILKKYISGFCKAHNLKISDFKDIFNKDNNKILDLKAENEKLKKQIEKTKPKTVKKQYNNKRK